MLLALGLPFIFALLLVGIIVLLPWVFSDGGMGLGVELLQAIGLEVILNVLCELRLVSFLVVVGQSLHVFGNVTGEDVLAESVGVEFLALVVVTWESLLVVRDVESTVRGTLESTEDTSTSGGSVQTNIEEGLEGATALLIISLGGFSQFEFTVGFLDTGEGLVEVKLLEGAASEEKSCGVRGRPVGQPVGDAISLELVGVGGAEDLVTVELGSDELGNDVAVGEADNQSIFGRIVLVLGLADQSLASIVVGL